MSESEPNVVMDIHGVLEHLPHRYPFLLVDRILELEPGRRILALKNVTINEHFFQGHFPTEPVMPGVLIIEALAQAGGVLAVESRGEKGGLVFLATINNVRFRRPVRPGDQLLLEVTAISLGSIAPRVTATARVGETVVAEAEIMFAIQKTKG